MASRRAGLPRSAIPAPARAAGPGAAPTDPAETAKVCPSAPRRATIPAPRCGPRGLRPLAGADRRARLPGQRLELRGVQLVAGDLDHVAGSTRHDPRRSSLVELPPQPHDQDASRVRRPAGRRAVPHQFGELIGAGPAGPPATAAPPAAPAAGQLKQRRAHQDRRDRRLSLATAPAPRTHGVSRYDTSPDKSGSRRLYHVGCRAFLRAFRADRFRDWR